MRPVRLIVSVLLLSAATAPQAAAVACMLMRSGMSMAAEPTHDSMAGPAEAAASCPITQCAGPVMAQVPELVSAAVFAIPDRRVEPPLDLTPFGLASPPIQPPPKPVPSNS